MFDEICANCGKSLVNDIEYGESSLYSPKLAFMLCMPCYREEEDLIQKYETNNIPELIKHYKDMIR